MILYDPPQHNVTPTDNHVIPTSHVDDPDGEAIAAYIEAEGDDAAATLSAGSAAPNPSARDMTVFSSRGPNGDAEDIIKPDVTAPGAQILAGNSPVAFLGAQDELFQAIQGTSMSSPHVAGVGALLVGEHPDWSPAMVRSALVTTGSQDVQKEDDATPADPFDFGGGHIDPVPAADPGLVYDAGLVDYLRFLCGDGELSATGATCTGVGSIDPSDLNQASIGIGQLAGIQTVTREVTNVGDDATYAAFVDEPPGVDVSVSPAVLTLEAGDSAEYEVTFTTTDDAVFDEWVFGALTWSDGAGHDVRSPLAIRPAMISAPEEVSGTGTSGSLEYDVTFGYYGAFETPVHGLVPATTEAGNVVDDPEDEIEIALETGVGITEHTITVAAGTLHLRAATFDGETDGDDDLDLYLIDPDGNRVDESAGATAQEQVDVVNPVAGDWTLVVHGWETDGADSNYTLFTWLVDSADAGNMTVTAPAVAVLGATETVTVAWSGLTAGTRYLGIVGYSNGTSEIGGTLVSITG